MDFFKYNWNTPCSSPDNMILTVTNNGLDANNGFDTYNGNGSNTQSIEIETVYTNPTLFTSREEYSLPWDPMYQRQSIIQGYDDEPNDWLNFSFSWNWVFFIILALILIWCIFDRTQTYPDNEVNLKIIQVLDDDAEAQTTENFTNNMRYYSNKN